MTQLSLIYSTFGNRDDALAVGRVLVGERLVGCANVLEGMTSVYNWNGAVQEEREAVLLVKTRSALAPRVMSRIRELHRYDCPAILCWELAAANAEYVQWICEQTDLPEST